MKNGARYVVTTHWGTFSLDEASYQDYLAGNLWICWTPGRPTQPQQTTSNYVPLNVTERAVSLRDQADKSGILATLHQLGIHDALVPYSSRLADLSIDEMNLTVRSSNGLKRANAGTFGRLRDLLAMENGILSVRNLGQKSAKEIKHLFFEECYSKNPPDFGDGESVLTLLFEAYAESNKMDDGTITEDFNELYRAMNGMGLREMDKIIYPVCTLCRDHQRSSFVEGIKVGIQLRMELMEE